MLPAFNLEGCKNEIFQFIFGQILNWKMEKKTGQKILFEAILEESFHNFVSIDHRKDRKTSLVQQLLSCADNLRLISSKKELTKIP